MRSRTFNMILLFLFLFNPCLAQEAPPTNEATAQAGWLNMSTVSVAPEKNAVVGAVSEPVSVTDKSGQSAGTIADKTYGIGKAAVETTVNETNGVNGSDPAKIDPVKIEQAKIEAIRQSAFTELPKWLDLQDYPRLDPDVIGNLQATIQHQTVSKDRFVSLFETGSDFTYSVGFVGSNAHYYYSSNGELQKVEILNQAVDLSQNAQFPGRLAAYRYPDGDLLQVKMIMSAQEDYRFAPNGDLLEHCQAGTCYRPDGKVAYYRAAFMGLESEAATVQTALPSSQSEQRNTH